MNPYVYGPQSLLDIPVRSTTLQHNVEPCTGDQTLNIHDYDVSLVPDDTGLLFAMNVTPVDVNNMVYHNYYITYNTTGVTVLFRPEDYQIFTVYGSMYKYPVPNQYQWKATFMENQTEGLDMGHYLEPNFYVPISAENVSSGWLYVGVRREGASRGLRVNRQRKLQNNYNISRQSFSYHVDYRPTVSDVWAINLIKYTT